MLIKIMQINIAMCLTILATKYFFNVFYFGIVTKIWRDMAVGKNKICILTVILAQMADII